MADLQKNGFFEKCQSFENAISVEGLPSRFDSFRMNFFSPIIFATDPTPPPPPFTGADVLKNPSPSVRGKQERDGVASASVPSGQ
jgi:hypothetical protein